MCICLIYRAKPSQQSGKPSGGSLSHVARGNVRQSTLGYWPGWTHSEQCQQCLICSSMFVVVAEAEAGRCLDPEENGVNPGGGNGGGPGPPNGEQDKQLISSKGGGNILLEQSGRLEEESGVTKETHCAQST
jgi:hypothetical protein